MAINFERPGRMMSGTKRGPEGHICVWNANLCTIDGGKFWFGDLDLTDDADDLKRLAAEKGCPVYVLREMDARFQNEANPKFENAVAVIQPSGEIEINKARLTRQKAPPMTHPAIKSDFAILDVKAGRTQLARRIGHGAKVCVRIEMVIDNAGRDDGTSIEFSGQVLSVTEIELATPAGCGSAS